MYVIMDLPTMFVCGIAFFVIELWSSKSNRSELEVVGVLCPQRDCLFGWFHVNNPTSMCPRNWKGYVNV
jgi:hypothetical protein